MNFFERLAYKSRTSTKLLQFFQEDGGFARFARSNFERCVEAHGMPVNASAYSRAKLAASIDSQIQIGYFV